MISHQVGELARNGLLALTIIESSDVQFIYFQLIGICTEKNLVLKQILLRNY